MDNSTFNERLNLLIKSLNISTNKFESEVGWPKGTSQKISKGSMPGLENVLKILSRYPELSTDWLVKGDGDMYASEKKPELPIASEQVVHFGLKMPSVITVDQSGRENIVMVASRAFAGYATNTQEPEYLTKFPAFSLPLPEFRNATFRAFQASGRSMDPTIKNGDWLIGEFTDNWPNNIKDGRIYIVVTKDSILVKRLLNRIQEGKIVIQSDNMDYPTDILYPDEIQEIWYLKANISQQFPNARYEVASKISNLEADVEILKRQISQLEKASKGIS
jgi:phage repressor protein C with HTH and peptisase S24 domain